MTYFHKTVHEADQSLLGTNLGDQFISSYFLKCFSFLWFDRFVCTVPAVSDPVQGDVIVHVNVQDPNGGFDVTGNATSPANYRFTFAVSRNCLQLPLPTLLKADLTFDTIVLTFESSN